MDTLWVSRDIRRNGGKGELISGGELVLSFPNENDVLSKRLFGIASGSMVHWQLVLEAV